MPNEQAWNPEPDRIVERKHGLRQPVDVLFHHQATTVPGTGGRAVTGKVFCDRDRAAIAQPVSHRESHSRHQRLIASEGVCLQFWKNGIRFV